MNMTIKSSKSCKNMFREMHFFHRFKVFETMPNCSRFCKHFCDITCNFATNTGKILKMQRQSWKSRSNLTSHKCFRNLEYEGNISNIQVKSLKRLKCIMFWPKSARSSGPTYKKKLQLLSNMWAYKLMWFWLIFHKFKSSGLFSDFWAYINLLWNSKLI